MDSQARHPGRKTDRESHTGRVTKLTGTVVGHTPGHVWMSAESTGGGPTDSHMIPHLEGERFPVGQTVRATNTKFNGTDNWALQLGEGYDE